MGDTTVFNTYKYIAAGCLVVKQASVGLHRDQWGPYFTTPRHKGSWQCISRVYGEPQTPLFDAIKPYEQLEHSGWIQLHLYIDPGDDTAIVRVYVLADDLDNVNVPRSDAALRKTRQRLFRELDFSPTTWACDVASNRNRKPSPRPALFDESRQLEAEAEVEAGDGKGQSLLEMFNTIPTPDPRPETVENLEARDAMVSLLESRVPGLDTELYLHQRRSAALMVQREAQPEQILDPRFVKVVDHDGLAWYYDHVECTPLREPRFYDRPRGGILAEEMGSGKTLVCLSLVLATKHMPAETPDLYLPPPPIVRPTVGSLADMAAACATAHSVAWKPILDSSSSQFANCVNILRRNQGHYHISRAFDPDLVTSRRDKIVDPFPTELIPTKIYHSYATLVIVPPNLVQQWEQEIKKHTSNLKYIVIVRGSKTPAMEQLIEHDIVLFSSTRFDLLFGSAKEDKKIIFAAKCRITEVHFKRCIVDEGHKLGSSRISSKSKLHRVLDRLNVTSRWVVTGTPSKGLYGVGEDTDPDQTVAKRTEAAEMERDDLQRLGSIASLFLQMRPWANTAADHGDTKANWDVYVGQSKSPQQASGNRDCLRSTLDSMIIRHPRSELNKLFPRVEERIVYLDPSYQDALVHNLFSMMIIYNAVQSQRADQDYFFHPKQRRALVELVSNLQQASFFGGSFFSPGEIERATDTAVKFLVEGKVQISDEDKNLLWGAISFGRRAAVNNIKKYANLFHELPIYLKHFPWGAGKTWSLDLQEGDPVCTNPPLVLALQRYLHPLVDSPVSLQRKFDSGEFAATGLAERGKEDGTTTTTTTTITTTRDPATLKPAQDGYHSEPEDTAIGDERFPVPSLGRIEHTLAGNTHMGSDNPHQGRRRTALLSTHERMEMLPAPRVVAEADLNIAAPLAKTQLIATASAKLSYLIDQIVKYQGDEQMLIFYHNDNVAYYLASALEMVSSFLLWRTNTLVVNTASHSSKSTISSTQRVSTRSAERNTSTPSTPTPSSGKHYLIHILSPSRVSSTDKLPTDSLPIRNPRVLLMDINLAAFGLDMRSASRIYFINPPLNPQTEAQAIGRARRISQNRPVTVETLVLRDSLEEVIVKRRQEMTASEQRKCRSILDDKPIYEWILNAKILPLPIPAPTPVPITDPGGAAAAAVDYTDELAGPPGPLQMAPLQTPQLIFGRGFGRQIDPDEDLVSRADLARTAKTTARVLSLEEFQAIRNLAVTGNLTMPGVPGQQQQHRKRPATGPEETGKSKRPRVSFL